MKGIKHLDVFRACYSCTGKVAETSEVLGDCTRCGVTQKIETCKLRFHAGVDLQSEGNLITVTAFTPILENICQTDDVTIAALLTSTPFNATTTSLHPSLIKCITFTCQHSSLKIFIHMLYHNDELTP